MTQESTSSTVVHRLDLPTRSFQMDVTDKGDKIEFSLWMSKVGDFGDLAEFTAWAQPIYAKYDHDRRPQVHTSPNWSESMTVLDNGKHFVAQVGKGKGS